MRDLALALGFGASLFLVACAPDAPRGDDGDGSDGSDGSDGDGDSPGGFVDAAPFHEGPDAAVAQGACDKIDILFVVDNSGSMDLEQANLATNFPGFATLIEQYMNSVGQTLDYHVGITSTDVKYSITTKAGQITLPGTPPVVIPIPESTNTSGSGTGTLSTSNKSGASCGFPAGRTWLQRGDTDVSTKLACAADLGINGSPDEMPLEAARLALVDRVADGTHPGFLREDALLAIVFLTDENDCSIKGNKIYDFGMAPLDVCDATAVEPVANYLAAFNAVKGGEPGRWAVAAIAGPGPSSCTSAFGSAVFAERLKQFTTMIGTNQVFSSICDGNLAPALGSAFETFSEACESFPPVE